MLRDKQPIATVAVRNLETARRFYEERLGLAPRSGPQEPSTMSYECGGADLFIYESQHAGTNQATAVTWMAGNDLDTIVQSLAKDGVIFESYDMPDSSKEGDVYSAGDVRVAWFKDPDGNVHAVVNG
jgi:catechol 2,3-dioxygenase-like lactoylglutathione lyase family enzyme